MGNKTSEDTLLKSRSSSASIKAGYRLYTGSFRKLFKASWPAAIVYAVFFSALGTISVIQLPRLSQQFAYSNGQYGNLVNNYIFLISALAIIIVAGAIAEIAFYSCGFSLLKAHQSGTAIPVRNRWFSFDKHTVWRTLKAALCNAAILVIPTVAFSLFYCLRLNTMIIDAGNHIITLSITALVAFVIALLLLPLLYVSVKYILRDGTKFWPLLAAEYTTGLRHLAYIFVVTFVCIIVIVIAGFVILLPSNILTIANFQANMGVAYGDPLGMPDNMTIITATTFLIAGFLEAYIRMSALYPLYFMYGSIETQERERMQYRKMQGGAISNYADEKGHVTDTKLTET